MKYLKPSMIIMAIITGIMFILTSLSVANIIHFTDKNVGIFLSVIFGAFCIVQLLCILTTKFSVKKIGYYLLHIGLIVFLFGSFMFFVSGDKVYVSGVEVGNVSYNKIKSQTNDEINLGFGIQIKKFDVLKYPPNENGMQADSFLNASVVIYPEKGAPYNKNLYINGPVSRGDWKIYLMDYDHTSYDTNGTTTLTLLFKKNPGEVPTIAAIVLMIIGSFIMAFQSNQAAPIKLKGGSKADAK